MKLKIKSPHRLSKIVLPKKKHRRNYTEHDILTPVKSEVEKPFDIFGFTEVDENK